jgi:hypothetical protein
MTTERTESAANIYNDPIDEFLSGINQGKEEQDESSEAGVSDDGSVDTTIEEQAETTNAESNDQSEQSGEATEETTEDISPVEFDLEKLDAAKQIRVFNKLTGLSLTSIEEVNKLTSSLSEIPTLQKRLEIYPTLLEKLKQQQDVMSYFPDEVAYKVAQLAKDEQFKGKEGDLNRLLRSDISQLSSIDVVKLHASLNAPEGVKNPFRYTIKKLGLDPDEVINNFDDLSEDEQDQFNGFAVQSRKELAKIGKDIEIPKSASEDIEAILQQQIASSKDDLESKRKEILPVTKDLVSKVMELPVLDDFTFKLDLTEDDKTGYAEFLTQAILSGDFNVSSDEGKQELYNALMDEIWVDNRKKVVKALNTHLREKYEREAREKYNNETPLNRKTAPPATGGKKSSTLSDIVEEMVREKQ